MIKRVRVLLDGHLYLRPETMAVKKLVRTVNLIFQFIVALKQQLLRQLLAVVCLLQRAEQRQRVESKPNLRGVAIDFVDRAQERGQSGCPGFFVVLTQEFFKGCFGIHSVLDRNFSVNQNV